MKCFRCNEWPCKCKDGQTIIHGDCREVLPLLRTFDLVITDPPYGINHSSSHGASWKNTTIAGDSDTSLRDCVLDMLGNTPVASFGTWKTPPIKNVRGAIVWDKGPAFGMGDLSFPFKPSWELIYFRGDGWCGPRDQGVWRGQVVLSWESKGRKHPHQKPVELISYLMMKHCGIKILDPFMGSGTTLRAAKDLGRKCTGIELEDRYCEIAANRLRQEVLF